MLASLLPLVYEEKTSEILTSPLPFSFFRFSQEDVSPSPLEPLSQ